MVYKDLRANIVEESIVEPPINVRYPRVENLFPLREAIKYKGVPEEINNTIKRQVQHLMQENGAYNEDLLEMEGTYKITLNKRRALSIRLENFSFIAMQANPRTIVRGLTFSLKTGKTRTIADLFRNRSNYRLIISSEIKRQIVAEEIPTIKEFQRINDDQEFYLTEKALVVFFQRATLAPGVAGIVEFPIPYKLLTNVIDEEGILAEII
ncbi:hypothetical protein GGQ84_000067 [Desulfitispora alkaliphila]|uniref:RsiV family protein n=1 Tax=Desulfitispora alkaliphila TaxID=622674 RepID=UPI003D23E8F3